ncbi:hypothetical protein QP369_23875, partial [Escherichia coli]|nr:hypothetical protein [Escherichia coli]
AFFLCQECEGTIEVKSCVKNALMQQKKEPPIFGGGKTKLCLRYVSVLLAFIPVDEHRRTSTNITRC